MLRNAKVIVVSSDWYIFIKRNTSIDYIRKLEIDNPFLPGHYHMIVVFLPGHDHMIVVFLPGHYHMIVVFLPGHYHMIVVFLPGRDYMVVVFPSTEESRSNNT